MEDRGESEEAVKGSKPLGFQPLLLASYGPCKKQRPENRRTSQGSDIARDAQGSSHYYNFLSTQNGRPNFRSVRKWAQNDKPYGPHRILVQQAADF